MKLKTGHRLFRYRWGWALSTPGTCGDSREGGYPVKFVFDTGNIELMDEREILVPQRQYQNRSVSCAQVLGKIRRIRSVQRPFSAGADFVLTYPGRQQDRDRHAPHGTASSSVPVRPVNISSR